MDQASTIVFCTAKTAGSLDAGNLQPLVPGQQGAAPGLPVPRAAGKALPQADSSVLLSSKQAWAGT